MWYWVWLLFCGSDLFVQKCLYKYIQCNLISLQFLGLSFSLDLALIFSSIVKKRTRLTKSVSKTISWADRRVTSTVSHHPPPCDQRTKWNKDLDVLHVVFCFTLFRDRSSSFQQTSDISVMQPWRIWDWLGGPRGWWLPRDHVSNDLHYNTIKWLVSSFKVRKHFLLFLTCFPASHPPPSRLSRPFAPH